MSISPLKPKATRIPLTHNKFAFVDEGDFAWLSQWKWYYANGYAVRSDYSSGKPPKQIKMHRRIMNEPDNMEVDHINTDGLDNRKQNLRVATKAQNQQNASTPKNNTSGFKGVHKPKRGLGWLVYIQNDYVGYFHDIREAAQAYNREALIRFGEFARLNDV